MDERELIHEHNISELTEGIEVLNIIPQDSNLQPTEKNGSTSPKGTFIAPAPILMSVKHSVTCHDDPLEDYKMTSKPRGPCLIINNIDFDSDLFPQRKGSECDGTRLADVFTQLGFDVSHKHNLTAKGMKKKLRKTRSKCKTIHDALVIIILSHGGESGVYGSDGIELDFDDILRIFDNNHCKVMVGKPKIFIVQACRGRYADHGDCSESHSLSSADEPTHSISKTNHMPNHPPSFRRLNEFTTIDGSTKIARTDMLLCFSCLSGYVSVRNELAGSWLGQALSYSLMTDAWDKDLVHILTMVSGEIYERQSSEGHVQAVEIVYIGWSKKLYFNPGVYK